MEIKSKVNKLLGKFKKNVYTPVYIPVMCGQLLQKRNILITGGTGGIGISIAKRCLENGAKVIITGRSQEKLNKVVEELDVVPFVLDIQDVEGVESNLLKLIDKYQIDTLINNAGVQVGATFGSTRKEDFDKTIITNLRGTYFISQSFSNYLINNNLKGNILNISSVSGHRPAISPYMISKWGITGLTEGMAKKLIKYGIVVNGIAPGPVATEMLGLDGKNLYYANAPAGRYCDPNEIANLAVFMISDMGRMIVGDTVYITGGCGNLTYDDIMY